MIYMLIIICFRKYSSFSFNFITGNGTKTQLILGPNTANSLLVLVRDNITKQPLSNACKKFIQRVMKIKKLV